MTEGRAIPTRLLDILCSCEQGEDSFFPPTEVFNETWMLRLVLHAIQTLGIRDHPFALEPGAQWRSEARLASPFQPRTRGDPLGEGVTSADAVLGHFDVRPRTREGLTLNDPWRQFVVVEAKMFSNLAAGTRNARNYNQAARNVACMAKAIEVSARPLSQFSSLGFFVVAPKSQLDRADSNLRSNTLPESVLRAVEDRIGLYDTGRETDSEHAEQLRRWGKDHLRPLVDRLSKDGRLRVVSWEDCIDAIADAEPAAGREIEIFYRRCRDFEPERGNPNEVTT